MRYLKYSLFIFLVLINNGIKSDQSSDFELYKKKLELLGYKTVVTGIGCVSYICNLPSKLVAKVSSECDYLELYCKNRITELETVVKNNQQNNKE